MKLRILTCYFYNITGMILPLVSMVWISTLSWNARDTVLVVVAVARPASGSNTE